MSSTSPPAGWYPDPSGAPGTRWWDGLNWSEHTQRSSEPVPVATAPVQPPTYGVQTPAWSQNVKSHSPNQFALITFGIVALYLVVAATTGIVFIGIVPILMSIRSLRRQEPLAPFAIGAAVVSLLVSVTVLAHHAHH
jgi:hypothetical protein